MELKPYALFALVVAAAPAVAQPTLTTSTSVPQPGQEFVLNNGPWVDNSPVGANVTMSFWNLIAGSDRNWYVNDVTGTSGAANPDAEVLTTDGGSDTTYWGVTTGGLEIVGSRTPLEGVINYTDNVLELKLPCTYGTTWTDSYGASFTASGIPATRVGTLTGNADAWGTLVLPVVETPNVLRVHVRKETTDQAAIATIVRRSNIWYFYAETMTFPLLKLSIDTVIISGGTPSVTKTAEWMFGPGGTGFGEIDPDKVQFHAYPNPASDVLQLGLGEQGASATAVAFVDAKGAVVREQGIVPAAGIVSLDVRGMAPGIYTVRVMDQGRQLGTHRVVVR